VSGVRTMIALCALLLAAIPGAANCAAESTRCRLCAMSRDSVSRIKRTSRSIVATRSAEFVSDSGCGIRFASSVERRAISLLS